MAATTYAPPARTKTAYCTEGSDGTDGFDPCASGKALLFAVMVEALVGLL
jgi:hypothetical protein